MLSPSLPREDEAPVCTCQTAHPDVVCEACALPDLECAAESAITGLCWCFACPPVGLDWQPAA